MRTSQFSDTPIVGIPKDAESGVPVADLARTSGTSPDNQTRPLVSIIIPFFNREQFLAEAIESVLAQTVRDWELLLINDGSTDDSVEIARSFAEEFPEQIRLLGHEQNQNRGASESRNLGIKSATGRYLCFLDSDDVFLADTLEKGLKAFRENPSADAVCGTLEVWHSWSTEADGRERDFTVDLVLETERLYQPPDLLVHNLNAGGRKPGIDCVIVRREFAAKFSLFEDGFRNVAEDQVFWAKVALNGTIYVMDAVLAKYRQHPASTCAIETREGRDLASMKVFLDWLDAYLETENVRNREVRNALKRFQRVNHLETRFKGLKRVYRNVFPLHVRYRIRDRLIRRKLNTRSTTADAS